MRKALLSYAKPVLSIDPCPRAIKVTNLHSIPKHYARTRPFDCERCSHSPQDFTSRTSKLGEFPATKLFKYMNYF
jgi:hypothetical protein